MVQSAARFGGRSPRPRLVSVVIPTRDRLPFLKQAIASVQNQTFGQWELLIIDDASEDETHSWLRSIDEPRIRSVHLEHQRHRAAARNVGLADSSGDYVIFLDDDDRFRPRALEVLVNALERNPDAQAACGGTVTFDDSGNSRTAPHARQPQIRHVWREAVAGWIAGTGQVLFRTETLRSIGGWNESLIALQDWELMLRFSRVGSVYLHPYVVREYRRHAGQWYPYDHTEARNRILESFLASLPEGDRRNGLLAIRTRDFLELARVELHTNGRPEEAVRLFLAAYRASPGVVHSPMFRWGFIRGISQALLSRVAGRHGSWLLEASRRSTLRFLGRAPGQGLARRMVRDPAIRDDPSADGLSSPPNVNL